MSTRNCYVILGISPRADRDTIRSAYRALAKRYHPDNVGPGGARQFQEASEAYSILSDPKLRRAYDRDLDFAGDFVPVEPMAGRAGSTPEPLTAEPLSVRRSVREGRPSLEDEFVDWTFRHLADRHLPKSGRHQRLDVEVVLSRVEAQEGVVIPIEVPALVVCPDCHGHGGVWFAFCPGCGGEGVVQTHATLRLGIPPVMGDGKTWVIPGVGSGLDLRIHIRVDPFD